MCFRILIKMKIYRKGGDGFKLSWAVLGMEWGPLGRLNPRRSDSMIVKIDG